MERLSDEALGYAIIRAIGACPTDLLNACAERNLEFWGVEVLDALSIEFRVRPKLTKEIKALAESCSCDIETVKICGAPEKAKGLKRRPVLIALPLLIIFLLVFMSLFIWDIEISGNESVTDTEILNALEESGVYIGAWRFSIRSDLVRSRTMVQVPELKWLGVSVFGSRAKVLVREATEQPEIFETDEPVKIVASRAGIIKEIEALRGFSIFDEGQTAIKGETLIDAVMPSAYADSRIVHARGSVFARTWHEISAVMPLEYSEKQYTDKVHRQYALVAGNNRINFYLESRIFGKDCDIIIKELQLGIQGLFSLPLTLVCETAAEYETVSVKYTERELKNALSAVLEKQLLLSIGENGEISKSTLVFSSSTDYAVATLRAECVQNIASDRELTQAEIDSAKADREENNSE